MRIGRDEVIVDVGRAGDVATLEREDRVGVSWAIVFSSKGIHVGDYFGRHRDFCDVIRGNDFVQLASTGAVRDLADADGSVCAGGHGVVRITSSVLIVTAKFELDVNLGVRCTVVQKLESWNGERPSVRVESGNILERVVTKTTRRRKRNMGQMVIRRGYRVRVL